MTLDKLFEIVCDYYGVTKEQAKENNRKHKPLYARHAYHYFAKELNVWSLKDIAKVTEKHHGTVINSHKVVCDWLEVDKKAKKEINQLRNIITNNNHFLFIKELFARVNPEDIPALKEHILKFENIN